MNKYKKHEYVGHFLVVEESKDKFGIYDGDGTLLSYETSWKEAINEAWDLDDIYINNDGYAELLDDEF